ncbi:transcription factor GTE8-like [Durio zibethinus]|uniref:Transcription factor GTE8-like n=1 Tax=Durio zibethinus TaxID=66656 RepID=A0A6P5ZDE9_DURZI|nr:transcription factor GTE8-like [Durio zibethinus]XP_022750495.1 transcription factor GTE8-like [Durio zibethinus]
MLAKSDMFAGGYYCGPYKPPGESEGSGSLGRTDTGIAASEDSSAPTRKCISLNPDKCDTFGVAIRVLSLSNMSQSKRKDLIHRLRHELKQIQMLQKKVELQRTNGVTVSVSSSSDIFSYTGGQIVSHVQDFQKSSRPGKKGNPLSGTGKGCWLNRGSSGKIESTKHASAAKTANIILMKQCEGLLKRLMGHQCGWVFNQPVDIVKLNIPDYFTVIRHPMDLGTIKKKIASGAYASPLEFHADVRLTFSNAMTYNPPSNDFHVMADTLNKFFEVRWKNIEKKLPGTGAQFLQSKAPAEDLEISKTMPPAKKRKTTSVTQENIQESIKRMTDEEKHNLGRELESLLTNMPMHIIDFLREHGSNGRESGEEEMEIDIDELSDDTLFKLRKLLDHYLQEKQKNRLRAEPCEIELLYESGLSNSSMQQGKGNDLADEDVDIGGNEPPVSSYPPVEIEKDTCHISAKSVCSGRTRDSDSGSSSYNESDGAKASSPVDALKVLEAVDSEAQLNENTSVDNPLDRNQCVSRFDQLELTSQPKPSSVELDGLQDGDSAPTERQISPEKLYRAALLKNRFADTILKAREKTLTQGDKGDPDKLCWDREELEQRRKKEKARLQAEAKAAEDARRRAEAEAAVEARRKRELEREKARLALLKMEKTVEINENFRFLEDLEMLRAAPAEQLPSSVDETSPDHSQDGLGSFKFGSSNPLEQLGLYMKEDEDEEEEEEEEGEPASVSNPVNDVEEGEID